MAKKRKRNTRKYRGWRKDQRLENERILSRVEALAKMTPEQAERYVAKRRPLEVRFYGSTPKDL